MVESYTDFFATDIAFCVDSGRINRYQNPKTTLIGK